MTRSKFIPITLAAFCGLALQLQASAANAQSAILPSGQTRNLGWALRSGDHHTLVMQQDGNVVLYTRTDVPIWYTNTGGDCCGHEGLGTMFNLYITMQTDGNLVLYRVVLGLDRGPSPMWSSNTAGNPGAWLAVQDDGNLVVYRAGSTTQTANNALWTSGTGGQ
jgi:hypothetical protein